MCDVDLVERLLDQMSDIAERNCLLNVSLGSEQDWGLDPSVTGYGEGISDETWVVSNGFTGV